MMVGSIPIVTGHVCFPFEDEVNWDELCINGDARELDNLINIALNFTDEDYFKMRDNAIKFWDRYCRHDILYQHLSNIVESQKNKLPSH